MSRLGLGLLAFPHSVLWSADFTTLAAGAAAVLPAGLLISSGVAAHRTVQVSESSLVLAIPQNQGRIGRSSAANPLSLVLEGPATNVCADLAAWSLVDCTRSAASDPAGGVGAENLVSLGTAGQLGRASFNFASGQYTVALWAKRPAGPVTPTLLWASGAPSTTPLSATTWTRYIWPTVLAETQVQIRPGGDALAVAYSVDAFMPLVQAGNTAVDCEVFSGVNTRATERLYRTGMPGAFGVEVRMRPKAARSAYPAVQPLWYIDALNNATLDPTNGRVTVLIAGNSYTTSSGATWAANDVVEVFLGFGAGATVVKSRVNGGAVNTLGTSGAPQGASPGGEVSFLSDGTSALNSRIESLTGFKAGATPPWAA